MCENLEHHQCVWGNIVHLFPDKFIPPIRVLQTFAMNDLRPEIKLKFINSMKRMQLISDFLNTKESLYPHLFQKKKDYEQAALIF